MYKCDIILPISLCSLDELNKILNSLLLIVHRRHIVLQELSSRMLRKQTVVVKLRKKTSVIDIKFCFSLYLLYLSKSDINPSVLQCQNSVLNNNYHKVALLWYNKFTMRQSQSNYIITSVNGIVINVEMLMLKYVAPLLITCKFFCNHCMPCNAIPPIDKGESCAWRLVLCKIIHCNSL